MFTSTSPSPQPSPRLGGDRELFPLGAGVKMRPGLRVNAFLTRRAQLLLCPPRILKFENFKKKL
jgi:hypothetical protein